MAEDRFAGVSTIDDMAARIAAKREQIENDEDLARELTEGHPSGNPITLGPRLPDPTEWADEQVKGSKANKDKWLRRTTKPRKNFKEEALKSGSRERYKESMEKVLDEDRWAGGMELVDESETIAIIEKRGADAYAKGVEDRKAKITRRVKELHPDRLALASVIDDMPTTTDEEREAKMIENKRGLQAIGKKRRGVS